MTYKIIKYGLLSSLVLFILYHSLPIGDYQTGMVKIFMIFAPMALLLLSFIVFTIIDVIRSIRKKIRFDFIPLAIITAFTLFFTMFVYYYDADKFWTKKILTGRAEGNPGAEIRLYKNHSFAAHISCIEFGNTFQGRYTIKHDTLILNSPDLSYITFDMFATSYLISTTDSLLIPLDKKYQLLKIESMEGELK